MPGGVLVTLSHICRKACRIAQLVRVDPTLLAMLVDEKVGSDKNSRFSEDFKTLVDVLIQEIVKAELESKFPDLKNNIFGEESNKFRCVTGEEISINIPLGKDRLYEALKMAFDGNTQASRILADAVYAKHDKSDSESICRKELKSIEAKLQLSDLSVWVDPIDGTNVYIEESGSLLPNAKDTVVRRGLQNVTVLIGMFSRSTGKPIVGFVSQPFYQYSQADFKWESRHYWGVSSPAFEPKTSAFSLVPRKISAGGSERLRVIVSDSDSVVKELEAKHCSILPASGAGYKLLCVAEQKADIFVLTTGSTYMWDTLAPHSLLLALGGGVINYREAIGRIPLLLDGEAVMQKILLEALQLRYKPKDSGDSNLYSNSDGLIAYRSTADLLKFFALLRPV